MRIKTLNYNVKVGELGGTVNAILNAYNRAPIANDEVLGTVVAELEELNHALIEAMEADRIISQLKQKDQPRDLAFKALCKYAKGMRASPIAAERDLAQALHQMLLKYRGADRLPYTEETALLRSLIEEWKLLELEISPAYQALFQDLVHAQNLFEQAYTAHVQGLLENRKKVTATAIKSQLLAAVNQRLLVYLSSAMLILPNAYADFVGKLNIAIAQTNAQVKARQKKPSSQNASQ